MNRFLNDIRYKATQRSREWVIIPGIKNCKGSEVTMQAERVQNKESSNKEQREITNWGLREKRTPYRIDT